MSQSTAQPVVFSGPSGVGKSTLLKRLFKEYPDAFGFSVSHTTRPPREGEADGVDYHFVTRETMLEEIAKNSFIEYAEFASKMYGTSTRAVRDVISSNRICILDVDEQGVRNIKGSTLESKYIFVKPPSLEELERRLRGRGTETEETIKKRLDTVQSAMDFANSGDIYDLILVNDDIDRAYEELKAQLITWFPSLLSGAQNQVNGMGDAPAAQKPEAATIEVGNAGDQTTNVAADAAGGWYCNIL